LSLFAALLLSRDRKEAVGDGADAGDSSFIDLTVRLAEVSLWNKTIPVLHIRMQGGYIVYELGPFGSNMTDFEGRQNRLLP
jgi:hypothetical protein